MYERRAHDAASSPGRAAVVRTSWQLTLPVAAALFLGIGALAAIRYVARPLALFVVAVAIAEGIAPLVRHLERRMRRPFAVAAVYLLLLGVVGLLAWLVVPTFVRQLQALVLSAPALADRARVWLDRQNSALGVQLSTLFSDLPGQLGEQLVVLPLRAFRGLVNTLLVVFLSAYWLLGAPALERFALSLLPAPRRGATRDVLRAMGASMGGYIRGTAINALIMGALAWIGLTLIGVPYALALGTLTMMLEPIPILGPIIAAVPVVLIAYAVRPTLALLALGLYTVLQQFEGHLLTPNIMRRQTDVPQTLVILALLAGGALGGLLGAVTSIPAAAALHVLALKVVAPAVRRATGAAGDAREDREADVRDPTMTPQPGPETGPDTGS